MVYTYKPAYYSTMQDSITSICKSILPFSLKKPTLPATEQKLSKQQSDNLKWQQNSFHQILNLMGLHKHGLLAVSEVAAFRCHLLDTLIAAKGAQLEQPAVLRDKLLFLQELLYAKCISEEEYHASKRPLLQRLAVQGVELEARDVIVGVQKDRSDEEQEEWSTIDLKDEQSLVRKPNSSSNNKLKNGTSSALKHIKDTASVLGFGKNRRQRSIFYNAKENMPTDHNPFLDDHRNENDGHIKSILVSESLGTDKGKKKPLEGSKLAWKQWGFDGFKRWKPTNLEDETTPLPLGQKSSDCGDHKESCELLASPDVKQFQNKLLSDTPPSSFIIDKVLGDKIKNQLTRILIELSSTNPNLEFSDDQMEAICTKLPVDKSDLKHLFPKSWCEQYGELLLDVVKKEFKEHVEENEYMSNATLERRRHTSSKRWTTFPNDDQNYHPNLFAAQNNKNTAFWDGSHLQNKLTREY